VLGDARDVARAVKEVFGLARHQFSIGQPLLSIGQVSIDVLDRLVVLRNPSGEVGELLDYADKFPPA